MSADPDSNVRFRSGLWIALPRILGLAACFVLMVGCGSGPDTSNTSAVGSIEATSGTGQVAAASSRLDDPIVVRVKNDQGQPLSDVGVTWSIAQGDGHVSTQTTSTGGQGRAQVRWTLGKAGGEHRLEATSGDRSVTVSAYADAGPNDHRVEVLYLVPSDREERTRLTANLEKAIRNLQMFYQNEVGTSRTFTLAEEVVTVVATNHEAEWYRTHDNGRDREWRWFYNVESDITALTDASGGDDGTTTIAYIDAREACGMQAGAGSLGLSIVGRKDLRGIAGWPQADVCDGGQNEVPRCRWVGGMGHELGHALGLPHPCEGRGDACDSSGALMGAGLYDYPDTYLMDRTQNLINGVGGADGLADLSVVTERFSVRVLEDERRDCSVASDG